MMKQIKNNSYETETYISADRPKSLEITLSNLCGVICIADVSKDNFFIFGFTVTSNYTCKLHQDYVDLILFTASSYLEQVKAKELKQLRKQAEKKEESK